MTEEQMRQALEGKFFRGPEAFRATNVGGPLKVDPETVIEPEEKCGPVRVFDGDTVRVRVPMAVIASAIVKAHGISMKSLASQPGVKGSRAKELALARHHFSWTVKKLRPDISFTQIAFRLNYAEHTPALHGVRKFDKIKTAHADKVASCFRYIEEEIGERL